MKMHCSGFYIGTHKNCNVVLFLGWQFIIAGTGNISAGKIIADCEKLWQWGLADFLKLKWRQWLLKNRLLQTATSQGSTGGFSEVEMAAQWLFKIRFCSLPLADFLE
jgi:hypothetical protein